LSAVQVLYEDAHLFAVNKPGGLATQADKTGDPFLLERIAAMYPGDGALGLPHRLDRPVSGVVLITRTPEALAAMNMLFANHSVAKTYWAIVSGAPPLSGTWEHRLVHDGQHHKARVTEDAAVEPSTVRFKRLAAGERYALLELVPDGGRFHQLRAQCAAAGFPIKGDVKYGARRGEKDRTIALYARSVAFTHPFTGKVLRIEAEAPSGTLWAVLVDGVVRR
jgi:23S rRNA pseudouridine1911/1915/1917 synthase